MKKTENKWKRGRGWPIFIKKQKLDSNLFMLNIFVDKNHPPLKKPNFSFLWVEKTEISVTRLGDLFKFCFMIVKLVKQIQFWIEHNIFLIFTQTVSLCSSFLLARPLQDVFLLPLIPWIEQGGNKPTFCYITLWSVRWPHHFKAILCVKGI